MKTRRQGNLRRARVRRVGTVRAPRLDYSALVAIGAILALVLSSG